MFLSPSPLIWPWVRCAALPETGSGRVEQQVQPVGRLLDLGAPLGPQRAVVLAAGQRALHTVEEGRQRRPRRRRAQVDGAVGEEVAAARLGRHVALAHVRALRRRQPLLVAARGTAGRSRRRPARRSGCRCPARRCPGGRSRQTRASHRDRTTGAPAARGAGVGAVLFPRLAVRLPRHVGQGVQAILRAQLTS